MSANDDGARYRDLFEGHDHAAECAYCPICTTLAFARRSRPEVMEHLAAATREVLLAVGMLVEEAEARMRAAEEARRTDSPDAERGAPMSGSPTSASSPAGKLRRIDIG